MALGYGGAVVASTGGATSSDKEYLYGVYIGLGMGTLMAHKITRTVKSRKSIAKQRKTSDANVFAACCRNVKSETS